MADQAFTDAARFKQLSSLLLDKGHATFPNRQRIEQIIADDRKLCAWMRNYAGTSSQFMRDAGFFFYRERKQRTSGEKMKL